MRLDPNPVFRKIIVPWYDNTPICLISIIFMIIVLIFAIIGIMIAYATIEYRDYIWVPVLLGGLSFSVIVSTGVRLILRSSLRFSK